MTSRSIYLWLSCFLLTLGATAIGQGPSPTSRSSTTPPVVAGSQPLVREVGNDEDLTGQTEATKTVSGQARATQMLDKVLAVVFVIALCLLAAFLLGIAVFLLGIAARTVYFLWKYRSFACVAVSRRIAALYAREAQAQGIAGRILTCREKARPVSAQDKGIVEEKVAELRKDLEEVRAEAAAALDAANKIKRSALKRVENMRPGRYERLVRDINTQIGRGEETLERIDEQLRKIW